MYTSDKSSWGREFHLGRVYPEVQPWAPPESERQSIGAVRLRYPFVAPPSRHLAEGRNKRYTDNNQVFDIFLYVPIPVLSDRKARCTDVIIMFQGTNETRPWHSWLYDRLGESLAQRGIASILLPTPFHLNRSSQRKRAKRPPSSWTELMNDLETPTDVAAGYRPFANFNQTFREVDELLRLIRGPRRGADKWRLFASLFGKQTRVSLLGFSLGGLRALAKLLKDEKPYRGRSHRSKLYKCILLSSGGTLRSLRPPGLNDKQWGTYFRKVKRATERQLGMVLGKTNGSRVFRDLHPIFFDKPTLQRWQPTLDRLANENRILVILGTKDRIRRESIARMQLTQLNLIPGMDHVLRDDMEFERHYTRIIDLITGFIDPVPQRLQPSSREQIRTEITRLLKKSNVMALTADSLAAEIDRLKKASLKQLYVMSKARFDSDADLVDSLQRPYKRRR
jgi:alpha-beta hydrolase superfamily lysophospholipase